MVKLDYLSNKIQNSMKKIFYFFGLASLFCLLIINGNKAYSQSNVGIGTTSPNNAALLDLTSTSMGLLVPRMTAAQKSAIANVAGLIIYQTDAPAGLYYNNGTVWVSFTTTDWHIGGNAGINAATDFLGTTDAQPVILKTNNIERIRILSSGETGFGTTTPATNVHILENNTDVVPAFLIQQSGTGNASLRYFLTGGQSVSQGIDNNDNDNFKISNTTSLTGTTYSDANTMTRFHTETGSEGIVDFNHQSRSRVFLTTNQTIATATWVKVAFNSSTFNEKSEFDITTNNRFVAKEEGYYQVNARVEFDLSAATNINFDSYVGIAIYANGAEYALGNMMGLTNPGSGSPLRYNNAPIASDIVHLQAGEYIEIFVYQNTGAAYTIRGGQTITYVSVHKLS